MLGLFQPTKTREKIPGSWVPAFPLHKNSSFQKNQKKLHRNYLCKTIDSK